MVTRKETSVEAVSANWELRRILLLLRQLVVFICGKSIALPSPLSLIQQDSPFEKVVIPFVLCKSFIKNLLFASAMKLGKGHRCIVQNDFVTFFQ